MSVNDPGRYIFSRRIDNGRSASGGKVLADLYDLSVPYQNVRICQRAVDRGHYGRILY
jgi:hypothetical protein